MFSWACIAGRNQEALSLVAIHRTITENARCKRSLLNVISTLHIQIFSILVARGVADYLQIMDMYMLLSKLNSNSSEY